MSQAALKLSVPHGPFDSLMEITSRPPWCSSRDAARGCATPNGKDYLDFIQGWAVNCLGHCPDAITKAIAAQAGAAAELQPVLLQRRR